MTMVEDVRRIAAGEFEAKRLAILDEVATHGITVVATKRGRAVGKVVPVDERDADDVRGGILHEGDLVPPIDDAWGADRGS